MARILRKQDIREILYGVTYLGGGGGGLLAPSLEILEKLDDDEVKLELLDLSEINADEYAVMVACLGSPVKMEDADFTICTATAVDGFRNEMKKYNKEIKYIYSGEYGGGNTFVPMLAAMRLGMPFLDVDGQGRAVPEINTGLGPVYDIPINPMVLGTLNEDVIVAHTKDPLDCKSAELIARQLCLGYDMLIGFSTWMADKSQMQNLVPGAITHAQKVGQAILKAKTEGIDVFKSISEVIEAKEILRGRITEIHLEAKGGFDYGVTTVTTEDGLNYYISFLNENLLVKDNEGNVLIVVPEIISFIDLETYNPLNNAETKVGMDVSVAAIPAHENWWNNPNGFGCWKEVLERVGYTGGPVRY